jgi:hypothetical protein
VGGNYSGDEADLKAYMVKSGLHSEYVGQMFNEMLQIGGYTQQHYSGFANGYEYKKFVVGMTQALAATGGGGGGGSGLIEDDLALLAKRMGSRTVANRIVEQLAPDAAAGIAESTSVTLNGTGPAWKLYETAVSDLYGGQASYQARRYFASVGGQSLVGIADDVVSIDGEPTAIEAKYVGDWAKSIYNPENAIGINSLASKVQDRILLQAAKYSAAFQDVVYHTNSTEFAQVYSELFAENGFDNIRFIVTKVK